ncbi:hypothetical protein VCUG_01766 [Vavraia culicis subsp. floridensis]|uniref:Kinesin motor domain-containing protein n=1 Tax=Vavraia culicis (isolate floridensis) TaxID=948595 RepID=L2GUF6_VAVCU|nr:uncharacterized protein VCUG_01766 [Vavraia culicis subsp. floridensis]ELA46740.1 hypothetical protein VCUG_01766 [Vavraia culicis subsp. floridensis]
MHNTGVGHGTDKWGKRRRMDGNEHGEERDSSDVADEDRNISSTADTLLNTQSDVQLSDNMPINVYLRIKPSDTVHHVVSGSTLLYNNEKYTFTRIFAKSSQNEIFEQIGKQMVINTIKGYNSTIFAYGQTGSGKTYTIKGDNHHPGIVPRIFNYVFEYGTADEVALSMLEIYNEHVRDLLCDNGALSIREGIDGTYVTNLARVVVTDYEMAMSVYRQGSGMRSVGVTGMNRESSRSHCVLVVYFRGRDGVVVRENKINIVDLAGSERIRGDDVGDVGHNNGSCNVGNGVGNTYYGTYNVQNTSHTAHSTSCMVNKHSTAKSASIKETGNINKSLLSLREVIKKLCKKQNEHINYRDSKLTFLLKDSLGGNSNLTVIGNVNLRYKTESIHTLRFLQRAKHIKNTPTLTVDVRGGLNDIKRELAVVYGRNRELEMRLKEYEMVGRTRRVVGKYCGDIGWVRGEIERVRGIVAGMIGDVDRIVNGWFDKNRCVIGRMDEMLRCRGMDENVVNESVVNENVVNESVVNENVVNENVVNENVVNENVVNENVVNENVVNEKGRTNGGISHVYGIDRCKGIKTKYENACYNKMENEQWNGEENMVNNESRTKDKNNTDGDKTMGEGVSGRVTRLADQGTKKR